MSVFHYEPFYDLDRLLTEVFNPRTNGDAQRRIAEGDAPRAIKPRWVLRIPLRPALRALC